MKILQINAVYGSNSTGRTTREMHEFFLNNGIDSYVAAPDLSEEVRNSYRIGNKTSRFFHLTLSQIVGLQGYFSTYSTKRLLKFIARIQPDIIILRNLHGNYINFGVLMQYIIHNSIPVIFVLHDCWFFTGKCVYYVEDKCDKWMKKCGDCPAINKGNKSLLFDRSRKMLLDKDNIYKKLSNYAVIGVSNWVTNDAKKSIMRSASIIKTIYNWIDLNVFYPRNKPALKVKYSYGNSSIILGVAAQWSQAKGLDLFIGLSKELDRSYRILLIGDVDQNIESELPENIECIGSISDINILAEYYSLSDVFVNPSLQETFGKTTAEALSCGTPVVAYNGTATPELIGVDGLCGSLIDTLDPQLFYNAIIKLGSLDQQLLSLRCRKRAEMMFSISENIRMYLDIAELLINNR